MPDNGNSSGEKLDVIAGLLRQILLKEQHRPSRLLRTEEAAAYLAISRGQLYTLIRRRELQAVRIHKEGGHSPILIDVHDLDMLIERNKT